MLLDSSAERSVLVQRQVRARLVVIAGIRSQNLPQMLCAEDENVIETVAPQRPDQSFRIRILPWRAGEIGRSGIPVVRTRLLKTGPYAPSLSRTR